MGLLKFFLKPFNLFLRWAIDLTIHGHNTNMSSKNPHRNTKLPEGKFQQFTTSKNTKSTVSQIPPKPNQGGFSSSSELESNNQVSDALGGLSHTRRTGLGNWNFPTAALAGLATLAAEHDYIYRSDKTYTSEQDSKGNFSGTPATLAADHLPNHITTRPKGKFPDRTVHNQGSNALNPNQLVVVDSPNMWQQITAVAIIQRGGKGRDFYLADAGRVIVLYPSSFFPSHSLPKLEHPNIITLHSVYSHMKKLYLAYEYERLHLNDMDSYKMCILQVETILWDVLSGFTFLQSNKFHISLSDECIYVTSEGVAKIGNWVMPREQDNPEQDGSEEVFKRWAQIFLSSRQQTIGGGSLIGLEQLTTRIKETPLVELCEVC